MLRTVFKATTKLTLIKQPNILNKHVTSQKQKKKQKLHRLLYSTKNSTELFYYLMH